ncbi:Fasciclin-domain-containing protein [Saccharata proteae CBS 121410]|uniref:Fasciclin-domain-containing protein n=1 Tax=Saccharata proteae CBS 121410 TaxID=1314787 RepID=A0A9P4HTS5_9PEZI|nr:Fasciclin-domain-containing protein [Saccharata proteae CBS 121410]
MLLKHLSLAALSSTAAAQSTSSLNATLANNPSLSNLTTYLNAYPGLASQLANANNITFLAPNNDAFATLLNSSSSSSTAELVQEISALLTYHVLSGTYTAEEITSTPAFLPTMLMNSSFTNVTGGQVVEAVTTDNTTYFFSGLLQNSTVVQADLNFTGGVIHIIDRVLTIPENASATALDIGLTAFVGAVNETDLTQTVDTTPDLTIFAPNNDAFQSIGSALANLSTDDLATILTYHVVNGSQVYYSTALSDGMSLTALSGGNLTISFESDEVFVNGAKVVTPNMLIANGVCHVIDNVLNPANSTATPSSSATTGAPAYSATASDSQVPYTSGVPAASRTVDTNAQNSASAATGSESGAGASSSTSSGAAVAMRTGAVGQAVLFGAGAAVAVMGY